MTISRQLTKRIYSGNGLAREWSVDFPVVSSQDIRLFITSPQGVQREVKSNYEFDETSHILTYPTLDSELEPLATGWLITLVRCTPLTQEIDLLRQGELDAEVLEQGYDKLTCMLQELSEQVARCIKYPISTQSLTETQTELTAAQVDALNSGVTREQLAGMGSPLNVDIAQIETNKDNIAALQTALSGKQESGDYATNSALTTGLAAKQDVISDLTAIRSGAAAGATALQPGALSTVATSGSYEDLTDKPITVTESYSDGQSWYRVYSDGWCEQGGYGSATPQLTITFLKPFKDTNYGFVNTTRTGSGDSTTRTIEPIINNITTTTIKVQSCPSFSGTVFLWLAYGYIS